MAFEEINPNIWTPTENEFLEGVLINVQEDVGENKSKLYTIENQINGMINVWGSTVLDSRMSLVKVGDKVRLTYKGLGEKKGGKNPPKLYKVEVDKLTN